MTKDLWINLPVKDITKAKDFFIAIGFKIHEGPGNSEHSTSIKIGSKNIILMLFEESTFKKIVGRESTDTSKSSEVLFSFDAESKEEVDELAKKVEKAGGVVFSEPSEVQGWMYGFGFSDLDGHRWNALYIDFSKMK